MGVTELLAHSDVLRILVPRNPAGVEPDAVQRPAGRIIDADHECALRIIVASQVHDRGVGDPADDDPGSIEDAWHTMSELRREGKIRYLGASNFDADQLARVHAIAPVTSLQPPYSIVRRDVENGVLPWCREHGVGAIVYSPMQSGLLSGKMTR